MSSREKRRAPSKIKIEMMIAAYAYFCRGAEQP